MNEKKNVTLYTHTMKITFIPDDPKRCGVSVQVAGDDLALPEVFEWLLIPALKAWGFHDATINEYLEGPGSPHSGDA